MIKRKIRQMSRMRFPKKISNSNDFNEFAINQACVPYLPETPPFTPATKILTIGSCFSANVAKALKQDNFPVTNYELSERLFTTFALKDFLAGLREGQRFS